VIQCTAQRGKIRLLVRTVAFPWFFW